MGIREAINQSSKMTAIVVVGIVAICIIVIIFELSGSRGAMPTKAYYTIDDGKTWFADSSSKLSPFDYKGKQAVRCFVFKGKNGKFVGLLEEYSDDVRKQLEKDPKAAAIAPVLVKKPGENQWTSVSVAQEAVMLMQITGRSDSGIEQVMP